MIVYEESHKESTKKFLELISKFSKVLEYKVNTHTHTHQLYCYVLNSECLEMKTKKNPFIIAS